jgi:hypothetical protein
VAFSVWRLILAFSSPQSVRSSYFILFILFYCDRVLLCNPGWPGTPYVAQADLKLIILLPLGAWITGMYHYTWFKKLFFKMQTQQKNIYLAVQKQQISTLFYFVLLVSRVV